MRSFGRMVLAGAVAALIGVQPAVAVTPGVIAELNQVHIELIDLDPSDGVTPWIQFQANPVSVLAIVNPAAWPEGFFNANAPLGAELFGGAVSSMLPEAFVYMQASAGNLFQAGAGPTFSVTGNGVVGSNVFGSASFFSVFTLSPNTRVVLSGEPGRVEANLDAGATGSVLAYASLEFCPLPDLGDGGPCFDQATQQNLSIASFAADHKSPTFNDARHPSQLTLSWDNTSAFEQQHFLSAGVFVFVSDLSAPVPEPSATALLVAGLGYVGWLRQRRRPTPSA